jgi:hypothetical protein
MSEMIHSNRKPGFGFDAPKSKIDLSLIDVHKILNFLSEKCKISKED